MRKSRLVILPTKCLNQIGFLLLFLSCPVLGDWGRIQPESEASHNSIQIARGGTCGLQRDLPGGALDIVKGDPFNQRRLHASDSDNDNTWDPIGFRRIDTQRNDQRMSRNVRDVRWDTRFTETNRDAAGRQTRRSMTHRQNVERRDDTLRIEGRRNLLSRSRSLERTERRRTDVTTLSRSMNRLDSAERETRRSVSRNSQIRREEKNIRIADANERDTRNNNRRESARTANRRDTPSREVMRRMSSEEGMQRNNRRNGDSIRRLSNEQMDGQRTDEKMRRMTGESSQRRMNRESNRRMSERMVNTRQRDARDTERTPDINRATRKVQTAEMARNEQARLTKRVQTRTTARTAEVRDARDDYRTTDIIRTVKTSNQDEKEKLAVGYLESLGMKGYDESIPVGGWTLNCIIGAVAYYMHTKQAKLVV